MPTSDELRAAAERVQAYLKERYDPSGAFADYIHGIDKHRLSASDIGVLLAEHPVDDDEPVTEYWLHEIGGADARYQSRSWPWVSPDWRFGIRVGSREFEFCYLAEGIYIVLREVVTRGDVRRLLKALGIEK